MLRNKVQHWKCVFKIGLEIVKDLHVLSKQWHFWKIVQAYLTHFSFLHIRSFDTFQDTSGCREEHWDSLRQNEMKKHSWVALCKTRKSQNAFQQKHERTNERTTHKRINRQTDERTDDRTNERATERTSETNERANKRASERTSEQAEMHQL